MKNIIYLIIDAFCYDSLMHKISGKEVTPFLNKLIKNSISFNNMYSQAPYTEASLVTILSNENVLENGGYLFGNGNNKKSVLKKYLDQGYNTIFSYSPYVYSKAYLCGSKEYYYTRLYSIKPLFLYRFDFYRKKSILNSKEKEICKILLDEAFQTWIDQCNNFINEEQCVKIISHLQPENNLLRKTIKILMQEKLKFDEAPYEYIEEVFKEWDNHVLYILNNKYLHSNVQIPNYKEKYKNKLESYQKKYNKIAKKQKIDFKYLFSQLLREKNDGAKKFINLLNNYIKYYNNRDLINYFDNINCDNNPEVSMKKILEVYKERILYYDSKNELYYSHIHVQDFHLPSLFHTFDNLNEKTLEQEMNWAFELLSCMDESYKGNIMADLSAHYCDKIIEEFFNEILNKCNNDFLFIVTADHGYPSYYNPPRPMIYNQTYSEAFHIPYIIFDKSKNYNLAYNKIYSTLDSMNIVDSIMNKEFEKIKERKYVLSEYGGPGAPIISEKEVWYTYIDKKYRVSAKCVLGNKLSEKNICEIINLESDRDEKCNLVRNRTEMKKIKYCIDIISKRHKELTAKFAGEKFYNKIINLD